MGVVISIIKTRQTAIAIVTAVFHVASWVGLATNRVPYIQSLVGVGTTPEQAGLLFGESFDLYCDSLMKTTGTLGLVLPSVLAHFKALLAKIGVSFVKAIGICLCLIMVPPLLSACGAMAGARDGLESDIAAGKGLVNQAAKKVQDVSSATLTILGAPLRGLAPPDPTPTPRPVPVVSPLTVKRYFPLLEK